MKTWKHIALGILLLLVGLLALRFAADAHRPLADREPAGRTLDDVSTHAAPADVLDGRIFAESAEVRIPAIQEYLHRGNPGFEELLAQILHPGARWQRMVSGGTREYLRVFPSEAPAQVFTTGVLMSDSRREGQHGRAEWDAFDEYWDDACMRDADIALRTGEILYEINEKSGVALQRLAKNLLLNDDPGCRRASFEFLARRASGDTKGYDPLLPGPNREEQAREIRTGRPGFPCAAQNIEAGERWVAWARQQEARDNER